MTRNSFFRLVLMALIAMCGIAAWFGQVRPLQPFSIALKEKTQNDLYVGVNSATNQLQDSGVNGDLKVIAWVPQQHDETIESFIRHQIILNSSISTFHPLSNCRATCQVKIVANNHHKNVANNLQFWTLYTYDCRGMPKTIGGDEFYLSFHERTGNATAAAIILD
jgi:hypothetical protein